jgi:carboxyl-terminal processing protease
MQPKLTKYILTGVLTLILIGGIFSGGLMAGFLISGSDLSNSRINGNSAPAGGSNPQPTVDTKKQSSNSSPQDLEILFTPFWEAWQLVHDQYVDQPVDNEKLMRGAIQGMLGSLGDPHTSYMDPYQFKQQSTSLQGEYEGIGAWVDVSGEYLKITSPMPNSPAEKAGLKPKDTVIAVDGEDMTGIDGNLVLTKILGPAGTRVKLTIIREGVTKPLVLDITRSKIVVPSVESKILENNIAYIRIYTFGDKTTEDVRKNLKGLMDQKPSGLIVDLRNNGGGYLNVAIEVASEFIDENQVVLYEQFGDGNRRQFKSTKGGLATKIPLAILVNKGTASASEIVAGAIQDYLRGKLVGTTSYGKGSVQNWVPLKNDQGAVRITIAHWLTPKERPINKVGLKPDIEVILSEEDIIAERDVQLERAIKLLVEGK